MNEQRSYSCWNFIGTLWNKYTCMSGLIVSTSCHCFHGKMALALIMGSNVNLKSVSVMKIIKAWSHKFRSWLGVWSALAVIRKERYCRVDKRGDVVLNVRGPLLLLPPSPSPLFRGLGPPHQE